MVQTMEVHEGEKEVSIWGHHTWLEESAVRLVSLAKHAQQVQRMQQIVEEKQIVVSKIATIGPVSIQVVNACFRLIYC